MHCRSTPVYPCEQRFARYLTLFVKVQYVRWQIAWLQLFKSDCVFIQSFNSSGHAFGSNSCGLVPDIRSIHQCGSAGGVPIMVINPSRTTPTQPRRTSCDLWREITTKNHQGVDSAAPIQHNHMQRHTLRCSSKVIIPSMMAILVVFVLSTFTNVVSVPSVGAFHYGPSSMWVAPPSTRHRAEALSQLCRTRLSATNNNKKQPGGGFGTASSSSPSSSSISLLTL